MSLSRASRFAPSDFRHALFARESRLRRIRPRTGFARGSLAADRAGPRHHAAGPAAGRPAGTPRPSADGGRADDRAPQLLQRETPVRPHAAGPPERGLPDPPPDAARTGDRSGVLAAISARRTPGPAAACSFCGEEPALSEAPLRSE